MASPVHFVSKPIPLFTIISTGIILFFLDTTMRILSTIELFIMNTPVLKQIYRALML